MHRKRLHVLTVGLLTTCQWLMLLPVVLIAGILWSSLVLVMAPLLALMSKVPRSPRWGMTRLAIGTPKESSEGLANNG